MDELGSLEEISKSIEEVSSKMDELSEKIGKTGTDIDSAGKKAEGGLIGFAKKIAKTVDTMANLSNQMDELEQRHRLFDRTWSKRFQDFEFQKESVRLSTINAGIARDKATMEVVLNGEKEQYAIAEARIKLIQAGIDLERRYIQEQQTYLSLEQAIVGVESARLSLRLAEINAEKAGLDYINKLFQIQSNLLNVRKAAAEAPKNYVKELESLYEPFIKIDAAASVYTKTIGGSRDTMKALRKETIDLANERNFQARYNTSVEELIKLQTKYNSELGRSVKLTNDQKESLAALRQVYGDEKAIEFATKLSSFGYDMTRASGLAGKLFAEASKRGIALDKYSKNLLTNIKMAQTLTFEKGINGLKEMAARATELNFNMQETAKASEKLSTLEGALEASSQLAVLGGNFSLFSNPLAMFHESLSDAEGLQDRIINQFSGLASWDSNRGQIYMSGYDRIRMREAAKAMGMDPSEVSNMVFEKARRDKLAPEINRLGVNDEIGRLLSNVAQLDENGNGYISINGKKTSLQEAAQMNPEELSKILRTQNNSDSENIAEIAEGVLSIKDNVEGWTKSLGDTMASSLENSGIGDGFGNLLKGESMSAEIMGGMAEEILRSGEDMAEFHKKQALWNKEYAEAVKEFEIESAQIQMNQTYLQKTTAEQSLRSAIFNEKLAELAAKAAPYQTILQEMQYSQTKKFIMDEARLRIAQVELAYRQAKFREQVDLPLQEEQLKLDYRKAKRINEIYGVQKMMLQLSALSIGKDIIGGAFSKIPFVGNLLSPIVGGIVSGVGSLLFGVGAIKQFLFDDSGVKNTFENFKKGFGLDTRDSSSFEKPDMSGFRDYVGHFTGREMDNQYYSGGVIRGDRQFFSGGILQTTDSFGGLLIGPSHSDGGIRIEAQGGEYIMPREQTAMYYSILEAMRNKSFPTGNGGFNSMSVNNTSTSIFSGGYLGGGSENRTNEPLRLDVTGTITLDLSGSTANIDAEDLLKEPLLSQLVAAISRSQNNYNNYGVASEKNLFGPWRI